jgi:hypothetical protein
MNGVNEQAGIRAFAKLTALNSVETTFEQQ